MRHPSDEATLSRTLSKQGFRGRRKRTRVGERKGEFQFLSHTSIIAFHTKHEQLSDASSSPAPPGSEAKSELFDKQDDFDQLDITTSRGGPDTVIPMFDRPATFTDEQGMYLSGTLSQ